MSFEFTQENLEKIEKLKKKYPSPEALSLPLLWMAQYQDGYVTMDAIEEIAKITTKSPMEIYAVATFYIMFNLKPVGKYKIQLCKTLSCMLCGEEELLTHLENKLGIKAGETTEDGLFTLKRVECMGSCGTAPMMAINDDYYENLTPQKIDTILEELRNAN